MVETIFHILPDKLQDWGSGNVVLSAFFISCNRTYSKVHNVFLAMIHNAEMGLRVHERRFQPTREIAALSKKELQNLKLLS